MIGLSINANNLADLRGLIAKFLSEVAGAPDLSANVHINIDSLNYAPATAGETASAVTAAEPVKPGKGKKAKDAAPAPVQTDIEEVTSAPTTETPAEATHDDMVAALGKVNADRGIQAVRDIIGKFGAKKVGEVKPEDRGAVIAAAQAVIAAAQAIAE